MIDSRVDSSAAPILLHDPVGLPKRNAGNRRRRRAHAARSVSQPSVMSGASAASFRFCATASRASMAPLTVTRPSLVGRRRGNERRDVLRAHLADQASNATNHLCRFGRPARELTERRHRARAPDSPEGQQRIVLERSFQPTRRDRYHRRRTPRDGGRAHRSPRFGRSPVRAGFQQSSLAGPLV